jgi:hypothetical protein
MYNTYEVSLISSRPLYNNLYKLNDIFLQGGVFSHDGKMLVESRKFLPLMYQLAARLGAKTQENCLFQDLVSKVV